MGSFDLNTTLMEFGDGDDFCFPWRIKHSLLGIQVFGSNGSGKSSSMRTLALKYLRAGYGFLILSAKSERATWEEYCRLAGRSDDLIILGENSPHRFDFMRYLSESTNAGKFTGNLLDILYTVIKACDNHEGQNSADPFWDKSLRLLLHNTISLCQLSGEISIQKMYDVIQSAPKGSEDGSDDVDTNNPDSAFNKAFETVRNSLAQEYETWKENWTEEEKTSFQDKVILEAAILEKFPKARSFKFVEQFFFETFKSLSFKTKSIILLSVSSFLFQLLQSPIYEIFCSGEITVRPEHSLEGKIVLLDLPTRFYYGAGRSAQLLFKHIWQIQVERRNVVENNRPAAIWSDESSQFLTEHDAQFQAVCRDCFISCVYICQNVHQLYAAMGGKKSTDLVASYLATLNTKIWFSNSCTSTNRIASEIIGDAMFYDPSRTITVAEKFSQTDAISLKVDRVIRAENFTRLKTGGEDNGCIVEAYIHVQGDRLFYGWNFLKIRFDQNYK